MPTEQVATILDGISVVETTAKYLHKGLPLSIRNDLHWQPGQSGLMLREQLTQIVSYELVGIRRERLWPYGVAPADKRKKEPVEADEEVRSGVRYQLNILTEPEWVRPVDLEAVLQIDGLHTTIVRAANGSEVCHYTKPDRREFVHELDDKVFQFSVPGTEETEVSKQLLVNARNLCPEKDVGPGDYRLSERWTPQSVKVTISSEDGTRTPLVISYKISDENWDRISVLKNEIDAYAREHGFPDSDYPYAEEINTCGSKDWTANVPDGWYCVSFEQACRNHDRCYITLGSDRDECDRNFRRDVIDACWKHIMRPWKYGVYNPTVADLALYQVAAHLTGRLDLFAVPAVPARKPSLLFPIPAHLQPQALNSLRRALAVAEIYYLSVRATGEDYHSKSQELARKYKELVDEYISTRSG